MKRLLIACAFALVACTKPVAPVVPATETAVAVSPVVVPAPAVVAKAVPATAPKAAKPKAKAVPGSGTNVPKLSKAGKPHASVADGEAAAYAKAYANAARANQLLGRAQYRTAADAPMRSAYIEEHEALGYVHAGLVRSVLDQYVLVLTIVATGESAYIGETDRKAAIFQGLPACREKLAEIVAVVANASKPLPAFKLQCIAIGEAPVLSNT
jgi:hypothetical protein